jgi:uncharacterized protein
MERFKASKYNEWIPIPELSEFLLYNLATGGIEIFSEESGRFFSAIAGGEPFSEIDYPEQTPLIRYLFDKGFIVKGDLDEQQLLYRKYEATKQILYDRESSAIGLTIGTTIICNMGCPYCFEFEKPNKTLKAGQVMDQIVAYIQDMINKSPVRRWTAMSVTWYGGEPLINSKAIQKLTPALLKICEKHNIAYNANIITNGLLLSKETWHLLLQNRVTLVQVTVDGPMVVHEKKRPLKTMNKEKNYWKILENLCLLPDGIKVNIRMNVDKLVAAGFEELLDDCQKIGLWPQRFESFQFSPAWLRSYEETKLLDENSQYLTNEEFFDELQRFKKIQLRRFNRWAGRNDIKDAKLRWVMPQLQEECATWVSPYSLVIDPEGYMHKCWETIHNAGDNIGHVSEGFEIGKFDRFMNYDRYELNPICRACKYLPVCDQLSCSHQSIKYTKPPCTYWKERAIPTLKEQYLAWKDNPDTIVLPENITHTNSGHENK